MDIEQINKHLSEISEILDRLHTINNRKMPDVGRTSDIQKDSRYKLSSANSVVSEIRPQRDDSHGSQHNAHANIHSLVANETRDTTNFMSNPTITINDVSDRHNFEISNPVKKNHTESNINNQYDDSKYVELSLMDLDDEYASALRKIMKR